jgi:2-amino-4-hydroxy-6-hydroxymethyldihydropteridine diphosphokinase
MFYDDEVISTPRLSVPHPLMQERAFALEPLCEIERERIHPVLRRSLGDIYEELKQREEQEI